MRAVVDTNVIVSGMINGAGAPGKIVDAILRGEITVVHSDAILTEYREVLRRGKFAFPVADVLMFLEVIEGEGEFVEPPVSTMSLPDPMDRPFIDAALHGLCPIISGNAKHFPRSIGVGIFSPAEALTQLQGASENS